MRRHKILLVDDSQTVLMMHRMLLNEQQYELILARNGKEAVERAKREVPDLILLDVVMPEMDGYEACRRIREDAATRHTPIIMVTTRGEPHNVQRGYASGCNEYLTKPFDGVELMEKLESYLGEGASR
jgi:CheY-like chemotaxis protein